MWSALLFSASTANMQNATTKPYDSTATAKTLLAIGLAKIYKLEPELYKLLETSRNGRKKTVAPKKTRNIGVENQSPKSSRNKRARISIMTP